jgi:excisionase family DNA binding protein
MDVLNVYQVAELLKTTVRTIMEMSRRGDLPGQKVGREWRYSLEALLEWLKSGNDLKKKDKPQPNLRTRSDSQRLILKPVDFSKRKRISENESGEVPSPCTKGGNNG